MSKVVLRNVLMCLASLFLIIGWVRGEAMSFAECAILMALVAIFIGQGGE